jgi:hypothetical protein
MSASAETRFKFPGAASDGDEGVEATGRGDVTSAVMVFMGRAEDGRDLDVVRWHLFDHVPEQFRVPGVRNGQRWVSTPECRAVRFAKGAPFDVTDYVVQYLFAEPAPQNVAAFTELGKALGKAKRFPGIRTPSHLAGGFDVVGMRTNPRGALGAYVLPWYPASGVFLTVETTKDGSAGAEAMERLVELDGVAGAWRYAGSKRDFTPIKTDPGRSATVYYLYDDPVETAPRLRDAVEREWSRAGVEGLFAAPFYIVRPFDLEKRLP